jgi:glycopeptide antibiotics resistance protein
MPHLSSLKWLLLGFLFAAGSEALQYLLPYRAYNVNDLLANMLGILVGFSLLFLINIRKKS